MGAVQSQFKRGFTKVVVTKAGCLREWSQEKFRLYIKHERTWFITFPDTGRRVEKSTQSGVFLTKFEVFGNAMKHFSFVVYSFSVETKTME